MTRRTTWLLLNDKGEAVAVGKQSVVEATCVSLNTYNESRALSYRYTTIEVEYHA
jgi:hypothetical protein